jgi:hypothetical protein
MALTQVDQGLLSTNAQYTGFKNRIINGAMVIDQRNAGASTTANGNYTLDRWQGLSSQSSKFTIQQNAGSVTLPVGFSNYLGCTSSSAYSITSGDYFLIRQNIEGLNIGDLAWGTASAKTVTLSFQVYSSLTGTFGGSLSNSAQNRAYPFSYSVSSANTWTTVSVTIAGDTSGTWLTTNGVGIIVQFSLGSGSSQSGTAGAWQASGVFSATGATSVVGTNGATFYITGVQLEKGSTATSFDYRPYGTELQLCQRYFQNVNLITGNATTATVADMQVLPIVTLRASPTVSQNGILNVYDDQVGQFAQSSTSITTLGTFTITGGVVRLNNFSGMTANRFLLATSNTNAVTLSSEL